MNLTINKDKTFTLSSDYIGEKDGIFTEQGEYSVRDDITTLENKQGPPKYYKIKSNKLIMLNTEKKEIKGDLEKMYILDKVPQLK